MDAIAELEQVFEQPDAGSTMDLGQKQGDARGFAIAELYQALEHFGIIQECVFFPTFASEADARRFVNGVILTHSIGVQYFINSAAAFTAEFFFIKRNRRSGQWFAAMVTLGMVVDPNFAGH
jgi:hypothetical protein